MKTHHPPVHHFSPIDSPAAGIDQVITEAKGLELKQPLSPVAPMTADNVAADGRMGGWQSSSHSSLVW